MARRRFSLEEGLRLVSNKESMAILSDANLASLRKIKDTDEGSDARISELIATPSCRLACVVQFQLWNSAYKAFALYIAICASNRGVVGGVPSHFGKGGR